MSLPRDLPKSIQMKISKPRPLFSRASLMVAAALLAVGSPTPARAANFTWTKANTGDYAWTNKANWVGDAGSPDGIGDIANLNVNILGAQTITLNANVTFGTLNIGDSVGSDAFIIAPGLITTPGILGLAQPGAGTAGVGTLGIGTIVMDAPGSAPVAINKTGTGSDEIQASVYFNDDLTITAAAGTLTLTGGLRSGQSNLTLTGAGTIVITGNQITTGGNLIKSGTGNLRIGTVDRGTGNSTSSYYGGSTIVNAGSITFLTANSLPVRTTLTLAAGASLDLNAFAQQVGSLSGAGRVGNAGAATTFTVGRDENNSTFGGTFTPTTIGNLSLTKVGLGTLTVNGANASVMSGAIAVSGGVLSVDFANVAAPVVLTGGSTLAGGTGIITVLDTSSLAVGRVITGTNIPANSYIIAVDSPTTFRLNNNPTVAGTGLSFTASQPYLFGSPSTNSALNLASGFLEIKGKAGLATRQVLGTVTVNQTGGGIRLVAGDATLTELVLGTLAFGTVANAGTLLVTAPTNTRITTTSPITTGIYGAGRAVFTADGTTYDWLSTVSSAGEANKALTGLVSLAPISVVGSVASGSDTVTFTAPVSVASSATTAASAVVTTANTSSLAVGMGVSGAGIPAGASIASITAGVSFTLSVPATATATGLTLNAGGTAGFVLGMNLTGTNLPAGAIISGITSTTLTLSAVASGTGAATTVAGSGYLGLPASGGAGTVNYSIGANHTLSGNASAGTLKIINPAAAQILNLVGFDLAFGSASGGILFTGTNPFTISGTGGLKTGAAGDLNIHNYSTGALTISSGIKDFAATTGITRLVVSGPGTTILTGPMAFTGEVFVNGGTLEFSNATATGSGTLGAGQGKAVYLGNAATLRYTGLTDQTLAAGTTANSHTFVLSGGVGRIEIPTTATTLTIAGVISGPGSLAKMGGGRLVLSGINTFSGRLNITGGILQLAGTANTDVNIIPDVPVTISAGATLLLDNVGDSFGSLAGAGTVQMGNSNGRTLGVGIDNTNTEFTGLMTGTAAHNLAKRGSGVLTLGMPTR